LDSDHGLSKGVNPKPFLFTVRLDGPSFKGRMAMDRQLALALKGPMVSPLISHAYGPICTYPGKNQHIRRLREAAISTALNDLPAGYC